MQITIDSSTGKISAVTIDPATNFPAPPFKKLSTTDNVLTAGEKTQLIEAIALIVAKAHV